jgi:hypothetical protein
VLGICWGQRETLVFAGRGPAGLADVGAKGLLANIGEHLLAETGVRGVVEVDSTGHVELRA